MIAGIIFAVGVAGSLLVANWLEFGPSSYLCQVASQLPPGCLGW